MKISSMKVSTILAVLLMSTMQSMAAIATTWGTSLGGSLSDSGGSLLYGNSFPNGYLSGCFVQLIWTGGDGIVSPFDPTSNIGVTLSADDKVVATSWIGEGNFDEVAGGAANGTFSAYSSVTLGTSLNSTFYFRVFDSTSINYTSGYVPTTGNYTDITNPAWKITQGNIDASMVSFNVTSNYQTLTSVVAVPEPSTIGLLLVGAGLVAFRRMRRS